jgi:predicted TIM-barrel fold metal-dependent hydrolase
MLISIEEHWTTTELNAALAAQSGAALDPSLRFNTMGDHGERLTDLQDLRLATMDELGITTSLLGLIPPGTQSLPVPDAIHLSRDANDRAAAAVAAHPDRFAALATLPTPDPQAAAAELERCVTRLGHVGAMVYGRSGDRPLDDPAYDDLLATAARLHVPLFVHPQVPPAVVRQASYSGLSANMDLGLATAAWGWHLEAGAVADYVTDRVWITASGMLSPRMLAHTLDFVNVDRILFSTDYPFARVDRPAVDRFFAALPDNAQRELVAWRNATQAFNLKVPDTTTV